MRIFYAAGASPNAYDIGESTLWKRNLHDSLAKMGHEVVPFRGDVTGHFTRYRKYGHDPEDKRGFLEYRARLQKDLLIQVERHTGRGGSICSSPISGRRSASRRRSTG